MLSIVVTLEVVEDKATSVDRFFVSTVPIGEPCPSAVMAPAAVSVSPIVAALSVVSVVAFSVGVNSSRAPIFVSPTLISWSAFASPSILTVRSTVAVPLFMAFRIIP